MNSASAAVSIQCAIRCSIVPWQPSTGMHAPLTQLARGEASHATASPTSSARPKRPNGSSRATKSAMPAGSACWRWCQEPPGNRMEPGAIVLTRMFFGASSRASALPRLISAAFTTL